MLKYIYQDLLSMVRFLPAGAAMGAVFSAIFLWAEGKLQKRQGKGRRQALPAVFFWIYVSVMLMITFFSRESGSRRGVDLELFSTWGINERNNAFVVENVLLFIPYGFLAARTFRCLRRFFPCAAVGFATSLGIELLQLATQRGYFQIDDILTNTLGAMAGYLVFRICDSEKLRGIFGRKGK